MKKILWIVIVLIFIAVILLIVPYFIPSSVFEGPMITRLQAMTGRTLTIQGKYHFRLFPTAEVYMEDVTLSNPPGFPDAPPLATLKSLNVSVSLFSLLSGKVNIEKLALEQPVIHLHTSLTGINNWQFTPAEAAKAAPAESAPTVIPRELMLSDVSIKNGDVTYVSDITKQHWELKNVNTEVSLNGTAAPFALDVAGNWNGKDVNLKARLDSLQSFLNHQSTAVDAAFNSEPLSIETHGSISQGAYYIGKAEIHSPSLKNVAMWLDPTAKPMATPATLKLAITSDAQCSPMACSMSNVKLQLDQLRAKGSVKIARGPDRPEIDVDLDAGKVDFNSFLPPEQHAGMLSPLLKDAEAAAPGWSAEPMDFSFLRSFDMLANIKTDGITLRHLATGKATLQSKLQHGQFSADVIDADMYSGKGNITVNIDATGSMPMLSTRVVLKSIQLEPLLHDAIASDRFAGTADADISTAGFGNSQKTLIEGMSGRGTIKVTSGTIRGINIDDMVHNIQSAFLGGGNQQTVFTDMSGSFMIRQGVISNDDLVMNSATLHVAGKGQVNLPLMTIDYRLTPQMMNVQKGKAAQAGLGVPIIISGSLDHPTYRPDVASVAKEALSNPKEFRQELKNTRGSLKNQLQDLKGLKNLLKGKSGN